MDPLNAVGRLYRGRAYAKMSQWSPAVEDLSASIHLDPMNWESFYHRACVLRKSVPYRSCLGCQGRVGVGLGFVSGLGPGFCGRVGVRFRISVRVGVG